MRSLDRMAAEGVGSALMEHVLQLDVVTVTFVLGTLVPFVVGLIVKKYASSAVKAVTNVALSVTAGVLAAIIQTKGAVTLGQIVGAVWVVLSTGNILHVAVYRPTGLSEKVQNIAPDAGLGTAVIPAVSTGTPDVPPVAHDFEYLGDPVPLIPEGIDVTAESPMHKNRMATKPVEKAKKR